MRIAITDSGVGGLSVCAEVESRLRREPVQEDVEILYLNAAPEDEYSYNSMPSRRDKLQTFDQFLRAVTARYQPDFLFIACNTLSVLFKDTYFAKHKQIPVLGIVETGIRGMIAAFQGDSDTSIIIFATQTTIEEGIYGESLREFGVPAGQISGQACPGLPDAISNDGTGQLAMTLLKEYIPAALDQFETSPKKVVAFLGCTHYGYQAGLFKKGLRPYVDEVQVLNPNPGAADTILSSFDSRPGQGALEIKFITRYAIPKKPIESLTSYIGDDAPATISALQNFVHIPELWSLSSNVLRQIASLQKN